MVDQRDKPSDPRARLHHLGMRLDPRARKALRTAARAEGLPDSSLARWVLQRWLREGGWLKDEEEGS